MESVLIVFKRITLTLQINVKISSHNLADVGGIIRRGQGAYDAIILDVDNGPEGLTRQENDRLYSLAGLQAAFSALRPGGVLAVWSAGPDRAFVNRLRQAGFRVDEFRERARGARGGASHTIWIAGRPF